VVELAEKMADEVEEEEEEEEENLEKPFEERDKSRQFPKRPKKKHAIFFNVNGLTHTREVVRLRVMMKVKKTFLDRGTKC